MVDKKEVKETTKEKMKIMKINRNRAKCSKLGGI